MKEIDTASLDRIIERAKKGTVSARVGYFDDSGKSKRTNKTAADIATINHEGVPSKNIPERPWIRDAAYESQLATQREAARNYEKFQAGTLSLQGAVRGAARKQEHRIQVVLQDSLTLYPGNAKSTIENKGMDYPLHETGWLYDQIDIKVHEGD